jgi:hypothetical protein
MIILISANTTQPTTHDISIVRGDIFFMRWTFVIVQEQTAVDAGYPPGTQKSANFF